MPFNIEPSLLVTLLSILGGLVIWGIRLEGRVNQGEKADAKIADDLQRYYATKQEVTRLEGMLNSVAASNVRSEASLNRIESKVDSFLVAAVRGEAHQKAG